MSKFLVPLTFSLGQFMLVLRRKLSLKPSEAIFLFVGDSGKVLPSTTLISEMQAAHANADGFLYMTYSAEAAFGAPTATAAQRVAGQTILRAMCRWVAMLQRSAQQRSVAAIDAATGA